MHIRRTDATPARKGVWRLYCPQKHTYSVHLWFDRGRALKAAQKRKQMRLDL